MREQIQVPFDTNSSSDKEQEEGKTKSLGRPKIAASLQKPKIDQFKAKLYRHCNCKSLTCTSPYVPNGMWHWVYRDLKTDEIVNDPILPKWGPDGDGWSRKSGYR